MKSRLFSPVPSRQKGLKGEYNAIYAILSHEEANRGTKGGKRKIKEGPGNFWTT